MQNVTKGNLMFVKNVRILKFSVHVSRRILITDTRLGSVVNPGHTSSTLFATQLHLQ